MCVCLTTVGVGQAAAFIFSVWLFPLSVIALNIRPVWFSLTSLDVLNNLVVLTLQNTDLHRVQTCALVVLR